MLKPGRIPIKALSKRQRANILEKFVKLDEKTGRYISSFTTNRTRELKECYDGMVSGKIEFNPPRIQKLVDEIKDERVFRSGAI